MRALNIPLALLRSAVSVDELLHEYCEDLYVRGGCSSRLRSRAIKARSGLVMFFPRLRHSLPISGRALTSWAKAHPPVSYPPISGDLSVVVGLRMWDIWAARASSPEAACGCCFVFVAVQLGFHAMLRVGELLSLTWADFADTGDRRFGSVGALAALRLRRTKTGREQSVTLLDEVILQLLRIWFRISPLGELSDRIFPIEYPGFLSLFRLACLSLGLPPFTPHSMRHGGTTHLHLLGWSFGDIKLRGRWVSEKSARAYIQASRALMMEVGDRVDPRILRAASVLAADRLRVFSRRLASLSRRR
jgi:hypothetical protein